MAQAALSFDELHRITGGRAGAVDVACPFCGPGRRAPSNRTRKVLRVWDDGDGFVTYHCERCKAGGYAGADREQRTKLRREPRPEPQPAPAPVDKTELARSLWEWSLPATGTLVERYMRGRGCWTESPAIRILPARTGREGREYPPTMIARFGLPEEALTGVHLTRLKPDGSTKAGTDKDKVMLGPSKGQPIQIQNGADGGNLIVVEGIEDAGSYAVALPGWEIWAAGASGRIAAVLERARGFERVLVGIDDDAPLADGRPGAGTVALAQARAVRPDVIPLDFGLYKQGYGISLDANALLRRDGVEALIGVVEWALLRSARSRRRGGMELRAAQVNRLFAV